MANRSTPEALIADLEKAVDTFAAKAGDNVPKLVEVARREVALAKSKEVPTLDEVALAAARIEDGAANDRQRIMGKGILLRSRTQHAWSVFESGQCSWEALKTRLATFEASATQCREPWEALTGLEDSAATVLEDAVTGGAQRPSPIEVTQGRNRSSGQVLAC